MHPAYPTFYSALAVNSVLKLLVGSERLFVQAMPYFPTIARVATAEGNLNAQ